MYLPENGPTMLRLLRCMSDSDLLGRPLCRRNWEAELARAVITGDPAVGFAINGGITVPPLADYLLRFTISKTLASAS